MDYPEDFTAAWKLYAAPKNSSKLDAFRNWRRLGRSRPPQDLLLATITAYNQWLAAESKKTGREYPKCHLSTWLAQARWEGFEDDAQAILAREKLQDGHSNADGAASAQTWIGQPGASITDAFIAVNGGGGTAAEIGYHVIIQRWFWPTVFKPSITGGMSGLYYPPEIICPSVFHAQELERRFGKVIRKAFGEDTKLTVAK